ncbi:hypothetical protein HYZ99_02955 [Candidatus Peregrinibacteria bacterium]|nr:hypothetical protein [Candidatus Peregrinibacteria bacterium]
MSIFTTSLGTGRRSRFAAQVRLVLVVSLACAAAACTRPSNLPPEQVLQNAARASQELTSARYTLAAAFTSHAPDRVVDMDIGIEGVLQDGGKQTQFTMTFDGVVSEAGTRYDTEGALDVIVAWENDVYLFLRSLSVDPPYPLLSADALQRFQGTWWNIPSSADPRSSSAVTPDPRLLRTQSEVVRVVKDHGIEDINGRDAYHYDVVIDRGKLALFLKKVADQRGEPFDPSQTDAFLSALHATGELWIDAETFFVHRIVWTVPASDEAGLSGELQVDLRDHGAAPPVTPPAEFQVFSPLMLLEDSSFFDALQEDVPPLDPSQEELVPGDVWEDEGQWFEDLPMPEGSGDFPPAR